MCPPILALGAAMGGMSTLTTIMSVAGAGLSAAGAMQQASAQKAAAEAQAMQYRAQAEMQNRQANMQADAGQYQEQQKRNQLNQLAGKQLTAVGGSGFTLSGSPTDVMIDSRQQGELDAAAIKYGTDVKTSNLLYDTATSQRNARNADQAASTASSTGLLGAITPFINLMGNDKFTTKLGGMFGASPAAPGIAPGLGGLY